MDFQADAVAGAVTELFAEAAGSYNFPDDTVEFLTVDTWVDGGKAGLLCLVKDVVSLLYFRFRLFQEKSAGLVTVIAFVAGSEIYGYNVAGTNPAVGCHSVRQG